MAKNTGQGSRIGSVKNRTQVQSSKTDRAVRRDPSTGEFVSTNSKAESPKTKLTKEIKGNQMTSEIRSFTQEQFAGNLDSLSGVMREMLASFISGAALNGVFINRNDRAVPMYVKAFNVTTGASTSATVCKRLGVPTLVLSDAQNAALNWLNKFSHTMGEIEGQETFDKDGKRVKAAYDLAQELSSTLDKLDTSESESAADAIGISLDKMKARDAASFAKLSNGEPPALWYLTARDVMPIFMLNHLIRASKNGEGVLSSGVFSFPRPFKVNADGVSGNDGLTSEQDAVPFVLTMQEMYFFEEFLKYAKSEAFSNSMLPVVSLRILSEFADDVAKVCEYFKTLSPCDVSYLVIWVCWLRVCAKFVYNNPSLYVLASSRETISHICLEMADLIRDKGINPFSTKFIDEIGEFGIEIVKGGSFKNGLKGAADTDENMFYQDDFYEHIIPKPLSVRVCLWSEHSLFKVIAVAALKRKGDNIPSLLLFHSYKLFATHKELTIPFIESEGGDSIEGYFGGLGATHSRFCTYVVDSKGKAHPLVIPVPIVKHFEGNPIGKPKYRTLWSLGLCRMIVATSGNTECLIGDYADAYNTRYDIESVAPKEVAELLPFVKTFVDSARVDCSTFSYV